MNNLEKFGARSLVTKPLCKPWGEQFSNEQFQRINLLRDIRTASRMTPLVDLGERGLDIPNNNRIIAKMELSCGYNSRSCSSISQPTFLTVVKDHLQYAPDSGTDFFVHREFLKAYVFSPLRDEPHTLFPKKGGSHYFRVYPYLLELLLRQGITPAEYNLVEVSSGSAGQAFAYAAKAAGFEAHCVFPNEISEIRRSLAAQEGAIVHLPDPEIDGKGVPAAVNKMTRMLAEKVLNGKKLWTPNHSQVIETSHALSPIASEILNPLCNPLCDKIDIFVGVAGNGSSLYSIGATLKVLGAISRIVAIETQESPGLFSLKYPGRYEAEIGSLPDYTPTSSTSIKIPMPGSGSYGLDFPYVRASVDLVDEVRLIKNGQWKETQLLLRDRDIEGLTVGPTSAASLMAALEIAKQVRDQTILVVFYDSAAWRY